HTCTWYSQLPNWVKDGNFNASTLTSILQNHCSTVISKYKGQIWDVVNEPFNEDGTFRSFAVLYDILGKSYIDIALQAARVADPNSKLYINDYNIDGLAHLIVGSVPTTIQQNFEQFANLGVDIAITELDIRMTLPVTDAKLEQQRQDYETVTKACNAVSRCIGVTIWDYTDKYSWIPSVFSGQGAALPWDENLKAKPAYDGIVSGFQ
ncbi:glycoside hydrolase family 10 protein, partial [Moniliophthora roreri MCA 2997]